MNEHDLYVNQWIRIHEAKVHKKRDERLSRVVLHERLCSVRLIKRKRKAVTARACRAETGQHFSFSEAAYPTQRATRRRVEVPGETGKRRVEKRDSAKPLGERIGLRRQTALCADG